MLTPKLFFNLLYNLDKAMQIMYLITFHQELYQDGTKYQNET